MTPGSANPAGEVSEWLATLDLMQRDSGLLSSLHKVSTPQAPSTPVDRPVATNHAQQAELEGEATRRIQADEVEHDLEIDLARAALETGKTAFDAADWEEANALFREALQILYQLPVPHREFCDMFTLRYRLAVCAFHVCERPAAAQALRSVSEHPVSLDEHRRRQYDASYLLSQLHLRSEQLDLAKAECERALQGRRRLLGKQAEPSLEATALMAHIWLLLNNRARAKAYSGMIPDDRRESVMKSVEASLGTRVKEADAASILSQTVSESLDFPAHPSPSASSAYIADPLAAVDYRAGPVSANSPPSFVSSPRQSYQAVRPDAGRLQPTRSVTAPSVVAREEKQLPSYSEYPSPRRLQPPPGSRSSIPTVQKAGYGPATSDRSSSVEEVPPSQPAVAGRSQGHPAAPKPAARRADSVTTIKGLSRMEILRNLRCNPVDRIEEAVCASDHTLLAALLKKRAGSWGSKMRKTFHSKRVSALHFAALFGEIEMADRLLKAEFDINEVPELSATRQTPLKFAMGARQVEMVGFLLARGARPVAPDTWATMAGLVMDRSWLDGTMSIAEKEDLDQAPNRIAAILDVWSRYAWHVNAPYDEPSGRTLLHRVVAFETGSYRWDAHLRVKVAKFLCDRGADSHKADKKGNTPYDMATVAEDYELLQIFNQVAKSKAAEERVAGLIELSANPFDPVELFGSTTPAKLYG